MTDTPEYDAGEEYFEILSKIMPDTAENRVFIANARNNYRQRSRYTEQYWNQREEYLRQQALKRVPSVHKTSRVKLFFRDVWSGFKNLGRRPR